jgi:hypothetical protein
MLLQDTMIYGFQTGFKENRSSRNLRRISTRNSEPISVVVCTIQQALHTHTLETSSYQQFPVFGTYSGFCEDGQKLYRA